MERYFRVFKFAMQIFGMGAKKPVLFAPLAANVAFATPISLGCAVALGLVESDRAAYAVLAVGVTLLYFIDYFCNGVTASLIHDEVTMGSVDLERSIGRTGQVATGILTFAGISAAFDIAQAYVSERDDLVSKILARALYAVWTTATYVVLPAMVLERLSFGQAFARSKDLALREPTQVGIGVLGVGTVSYALGAATFTLAYRVLGALAESAPMLGGFLFFTIVNVFWALSGYLKVTYFTCFYLWARECDREQTATPALAPAPLAAVL